MQLISLNIWGGKVFEPLMNFIKEESKSVDIFCFQEVFNNPKKAVYEGANLNIFSDISNLIPDFTGYFSPCQDNFGLACFIKNNLEAEVKDQFVFGEKDKMIKSDLTTLPRNIQIINLRFQNLTIFNYHGLWLPGSKLDNSDRLEASKKIKTLVSGFSGKKILCGDFNLEPHTKSLEILEDGMRNLIKESGIKSTRSALYTKPVKFADYILVSKDIQIKKFEVTSKEVSDHLPLFLEFD